MSQAYDQVAKVLDTALDRYFDQLVKHGEFGAKYRSTPAADQQTTRIAFKARALEASTGLLIAQYKKRLN